MPSFFRAFTGRLLMALLACAAWPAAEAQEGYPNRPVTLMVGFGPGSVTDRLVRVLARGMRENLKQPVMVVNHPGAGGNRAASFLTHLVPDGYTVLLTTVSNSAMGPALYPQYKFDPVTSFEPVALVARFPLVLVASPSFPGRTAAELLSHLRTQPEGVPYGSIGVGSAGHVTGELLKAKGKLALRHEPYPSLDAALNANARGDTMFLINALPGLIAQAKSGTIRPIAVTSAQRSPMLADVPTLAESALPGFEASSWAGIVAPANTPAQTVVRLQTAIEATLKMPAVRDELLREGVELSYLPGAQFREFIRAEVELWSDLILRNQIHGE